MNLFPLISRIRISFFSLVMVPMALNAAWSCTAESKEFPDTWYFSPNGGVRTKWEGKPAAAWSAKEWIGDSVDLSETTGKVVVLDFWATWCGPCVAAIPKNIELVKEHPDDLVFVGLHSATSGWDKAAGMVSAKQINYPVALDTGDTAKAYGITAFPTYIVIDRQGVVRAAGITPKYVGEVVKKLIGEKASSPVSTAANSLNAAWFHEGARLMRPWAEQFGKPAAEVAAAEWWIQSIQDEGTPAEVDVENTDRSSDGAIPVGYRDEDLTGMIRVLHFTRPSIKFTHEHLKTFNEVAKKFRGQGIAFITVCDHETDWDLFTEQADNLGLTMAAVLDRAPEVGTETASSKTAQPNTPNPSTARPLNVATEVSVAPREAGSTASKYGIRIAPVTVIVDRQGLIRATGLKLSNLEEAMNQLLAEPIK